MDDKTMSAWQNVIHSILRNMLDVLTSVERRVAALEEIESRGEADDTR